MSVYVPYFSNYLVEKETLKRVIIHNRVPFFLPITPSPVLSFFLPLFRSHRHHHQYLPE